MSTILTRKIVTRGLVRIESRQLAPSPVLRKEVRIRTGLITHLELITHPLLAARHGFENSNAGQGFAGHAALTLATDSTSGDPTGPQVITGATGTLSDSTLGIRNASITGVLARNFDTPDDVISGAWKPGDVPFPESFSELSVLIPPPPDTAITYTDLFYPGGSPQTCWDYPFAGGLLDPYGVMFALSNGDYVDLWSDGSVFVPTMSPVYLTYGFAVTIPHLSPDGTGSAISSSVACA